MLALITVLAETASQDVAEATKEVKNPILPVANEMFWAFVFFVLLWALMKYVLLPPIMKTFQDRADKVRDDLAAAEAAETARITKLEQYEAELAGARAEAVALIEQARSEGDAAWPGPVWGHGLREPYKRDDFHRFAETIRAAL